MKDDIYIDIDGTLSVETDGWDYKNRTPNVEAIEALKQLKSEGKKIILYTSRGLVPKLREDTITYNKDYFNTKEWLKDNNVIYDELKMGKPHYDSHYDDKSFNSLRTKVLCFSGGVDSLVASYYLGMPKLIYFDLGTPYTKNELSSINALKEYDSKFEDIIIDNSLKVTDSELKDIGETKTDIIPYRNLMLLSLASKYGSDLYLAGIAGDKSRDKTPDTFKHMEYTLNFLTEETNRNFTINSPFWNMTKGKIIEWFLKNVTDAEILLMISMSCFSSDSLDIGCGVCNACLRKYYGLIYAYDKLGMKFEWQNYFKVNPMETDTFNYYVNNVDKYSSSRFLEMVKVHKILNII